MLPFRPTAVSAGASALLLVSSSATAKELTPDPVVPHAPAELSGGAYFGGALAAAGGLAVAGAPLANTDVGSAWSLGVVQQDWSAEELVPLAPPAEGYFGSAVAIDQQGAIAVAMPGAGTGKVMMFENGDVTDLQVTLGTTSTLGSSLALSQGLLLVGDQTSKSCLDGNCGAVFQFQNLGGWKQVGEPILASTPVTGQKFGAAIALFAGDPVTAAIGAPGDIVDMIATGAVYLMHDDKINGWIVQRLASPPGLIDGDEFGSQVALSEQWVLATTFDSGHVYAFNRITEMWISLDDLVKSGGSHRSVTIAGDLAAIGDYDANDLDGAVTVLTIEGDDFSFLSQLDPPQMGLLGRFGLGATLDGETLWIGEPGNGAGRVHRFVVKSSPGEPCGDDYDCASGQCSMEICSDPSNETTGESTSDTGTSGASATTSPDPTGTAGGVTTTADGVTTAGGGSEGGVGVDIPDLFDGCECNSTDGSTQWQWFSLLLLARGRRRTR